MGHEFSTSLLRSDQARHHRAASFAIDACLRAIARTQLGLVTYTQATDAGVGKHALARRRAEGALVQIFPGVMRMEPVQATVEQRILAAGLAVPGVSHQWHVGCDCLSIPDSGLQHRRGPSSGAEHRPNPGGESRRNSDRSPSDGAAKSTVDDDSSSHAERHVDRIASLRQFVNDRTVP